MTATRWSSDARRGGRREAAMREGDIPRRRDAIWYGSAGEGLGRRSAAERAQQRGARSACGSWGRESRGRLGQAVCGIGLRAANERSVAGLRGVGA